MFTFRLEHLVAANQLKPKKLNTYRHQSVQQTHLLMKQIIRLTTVFVVWSSEGRLV